MHSKILQLDSRDNVLIALADLSQGESIEFSGKSYKAFSNVPAKHKFATEDLPVGADVMMYGVLVGKAVKPIRQGEKLTTGNVQHQAANSPVNSGGRRRRFRAGSRAHSPDFIDRMGRWARGTTGWWCRWCSAKTGISPI
jgi:hypothetical protein